MAGPRIDQNDLVIAHRLLQYAVQQPAEVLFFVEGADHNRAEHLRSPLSPSFESALPVMARFVAKPYQQVTGHLFEQALAGRAEALAPAAAFALAEGRRAAWVDARDQDLYRLLEREAARETALGGVLQYAADKFTLVCGKILVSQAGDFRSFQPAQVRLQAQADIRERGVRLRQAKDAGVQALLEAAQLLGVVAVVGVVWFHLGDVVDVRDDHVARVAQHQVGGESGAAQGLDCLRQGVQVPVGDIARQQPAQIAADFAGFTLATAVSLVGDDRRQAALHCRPEAGEALQDLGQQGGAALGERIGEQHWQAAQRQPPVAQLLQRPAQGSPRQPGAHFNLSRKRALQYQRYPIRLERAAPRPLLPVGVRFITQADQQVAGLLLEGQLVRLAEILAPVPGLSLAVSPIFLRHDRLLQGLDSLLPPHPGAVTAPLEVIQQALEGPLPVEY